MNKYSLLLLITSVFSLSVQAQDLSSPQQVQAGDQLNPSDYEALGVTIVNKKTKAEISMVCVDGNAQYCNAYRYVERIGRTGSKYSVLSPDNVTNEQYKIERKKVKPYWLMRHHGSKRSDYLLGNSSYWITEDMADQINTIRHTAYEDCWWSGNFAATTVCWGMLPIAGFYGIPVWVVSAAVDAVHVVVFALIDGLHVATLSVVDGLHVVTVLPFEALSVAIHNAKLARAEKLIMKAGFENFQHKKVKVADKVYEKIKSTLSSPVAQ